MMSDPLERLRNAKGRLPHDKSPLQPKI